MRSNNEDIMRSNNREEITMHWIFAKAGRAILLSAGILVCASGLLMDSARAQVFRVDLTGTFTGATENPPFIAPGTPFSGSFLVNTDPQFVVHAQPGGVRSPATAMQRSLRFQLRQAA